MNSLTAGWVLTGASAQWHNARPGKVAQTLVEGDYANPIVVLDEVDKTGGDHRYDPMGALYALLERDTAMQFKDEFLDVSMDASHILWVATANDESVLPEPILNRMNVYVIERPDAEGSRHIALSVYHEILDAHAAVRNLPTLSSTPVQERLRSAVPPSKPPTRTPPTLSEPTLALQPRTPAPPCATRPAPPSLLLVSSPASGQESKSAHSAVSNAGQES